MKKNVKIIFFVMGVFGLCFFLLRGVDVASAKDPDYPTKPINFYIAMGVGGTTDLASRAFCDTSSKYLGQPFIPINRPGAAGTLTAVSVMNAKPDGYTLGTCFAGNVFYAPYSDESPYRDISGFTFIMNFGTYIYPLMVRSDAP